jgi:hypothetical protein
MKKTLILILLVSAFKVFAQHPDLRQVWYAQSVTINSVTTEIPNDPIELPYVYLHFFNSTSGLLGSGNTKSYYATNCDIGFVGHANYMGTDIFEFIDFTISQDITNCSTEFINFMNIYVNFFSDTITEQFTYNITTEADNSKTMLVTNNNGDNVIYTNTFFNSAPQDMTNNNWYLHNLIIEGVDNNIPSNNTELSEITLNFNDSGNSLSTNSCSFLIAPHFFDFTLSQFYLYEPGASLSACGIPSNNVFDNLYTNEFYLGNLPGPFSYEHIINGSTETLTVTNAVGNQAVYRNFSLLLVLSTQEFTNSIFSIYPNPVSEFLNIEVPNNEKILQVSVYNLLGKKILTTTENSINLSKYENGIYLVKVLTKNGGSTTKKIIKIGY